MGDQGRDDRLVPEPDQVYQDLVNGRLDATFQDKTQAGYSFLKTPRGSVTRAPT